MELDKTHVDNKNLKFIKHVRSQSTYNIYIHITKIILLYIYATYTVLLLYKTI